jgi:hypothetical protein
MRARKRGKAEHVQRVAPAQPAVAVGHGDDEPVSDDGDDGCGDSALAQVSDIRWFAGQDYRDPTQRVSSNLFKIAKGIEDTL